MREEMVSLVPRSVQTCYDHCYEMPLPSADCRVPKARTFKKRKKCSSLQALGPISLR